MKKHSFNLLFLCLVVLTGVSFKAQDVNVPQKWPSPSGIHGVNSSFVTNVFGNEHVAAPDDGSLGQNGANGARFEPITASFVFPANPSQGNVSCHGAANGWAKVAPPSCSAGTNTFVWSPGGQTTDSIGGLSAGTYSVRIVCGTDTTVESFTITEPAAVAAPVTSKQNLCGGATVADLAATGTNIKWYASATGGTPLAAATVLVSGTNYYASQTVGGCESATRAVDSVTIVGTVGPLNDTSYCAGSPAAVHFNGAAGNVYNWTATQHGTGIAPSGTGNINFGAVNNGNGVITDTVVATATYNLAYTYAITDSSYSFRDTTGSTYVQNMYVGATESVGPFPIGFTFDFFGTSYSQLYISKWGGVSFSSASGISGGSGGTWNSNTVFGQFRDWILDGNSRVAYKTTGTAPNRQLIVTFDSLQAPTTYIIYPVVAGPRTGNFQIVLHESSNVIESNKESAPEASFTPFGFPIQIPLSPNNEGVKSSASDKVMINGRDNDSWIAIENENKVFTPVGIGCTGATDTFLVRVNPVPQVDSIPNVTVCSGSAVSAINFTTPTTGGTVTYNWTNDNAGIGLAVSGSGSLASFTATNATNAAVTATITVTPTFTNGNVNCSGAPQSFTITVNPVAVMNTVSDQTFCAGAASNAIAFSGSVPGTVYNWTNSNSAIGLAASGTGDVPAFVPVNASPTAVNATVTVTPTTTAGCAGTPVAFTVTVNGLSVAPSSVVNPTPVVCSNNAFATLSVSGGVLGSDAAWKWYADSLNTASVGSGTTLANIPVSKSTTYFVRAEGSCNATTAVSTPVQLATLVSHVRQHWSDVLLFDNSSKNFVQWQWYKNGAAVPGATRQQYSESSALNGVYYVVSTDKTGAVATSCPMTVAPSSFTGLRLSLFPNPVGTGASLTITSGFSATELQGASLLISDVFGRVVKTLSSPSVVTTVQAPSPAGVYVVTLTLQNGTRYSTNLLAK